MESTAEAELCQSFGPPPVCCGITLWLWGLWIVSKERCDTDLWSQFYSQTAPLRLDLGTSFSTVTVGAVPAVSEQTSRAEWCCCASKLCNPSLTVPASGSAMRQASGRSISMHLQGCKFQPSPRSVVQVSLLYRSLEAPVDHLPVPTKPSYTGAAPLGADAQIPAGQTGDEAWQVSSSWLGPRQSGRQTGTFLVASARVQPKPSPGEVPAGGASLSARQHFPAKLCCGATQPLLPPLSAVPRSGGSPRVRSAKRIFAV